MPAGSKMGPLLAKAKPISASVITYLRRRKTLRERAFAARERSEKMELEGLTHPLHPAFTLTTVPPCSHKRSSALLPFLLIPSQLHGGLSAARGILEGRGEYKNKTA
ncbi:junction-mediating and -regulatory protein-like [Grus japonensis]|uniref:Junction-mediating and -regulatory protein-like n=1 Tax=Grus japonensis TaxID=30415 RepID=A0ABC9VY15_GRUJA